MKPSPAVSRRVSRTNQFGLSQILLNARAAVLIFALLVSGCSFRFNAARQPEKTGVYHTVQKGETLWRISEAYAVSVANIRKANNLKGDFIEAGQKLLIPGAKRLRKIRSKPSVSTGSEPEKGTAPPKPALIVKPKKSAEAGEKSFIRPVSAGNVSTSYEKKLIFETAPGETVRAAGSGRVFYAGETKTYRSTLIIEHAGGFYSIYGGDLVTNARKGDIVQRGAAIGRIEAGGKEKPMLYFEIRRGSEPVNPLAYFEN